MTNLFFNHRLVDLHYYRFGNGPKTMLCFHGYGMHGKQFSILKEKFGSEYTFYGLDLFFHKETKLKNQSLDHIKEPINKSDFTDIITSFCLHESIDRFSIIAYSLGTYYASVIAEFKADKIDKIIMLAPAFLRTFLIFRILAKNKTANYTFHKIFMNKHIVLSALKAFKKLSFIDEKTFNILFAEMSIPEMRFTLYANITYLRYLETNTTVLLNKLNAHNIKTCFIFGQHDAIYHSKLADSLILKLNNTQKIILNEDHDMINHRLSDKIHHLFYDN